MYDRPQHGNAVIHSHRDHTLGDPELEARRGLLFDAQRLIEQGYLELREFCRTGNTPPDLMRLLLPELGWH